MDFYYACSCLPEISRKLALKDSVARVYQISSIKYFTRKISFFGEGLFFSIYKFNRILRKERD